MKCCYYYAQINRYCHLAPENLRKAVSVLDARENGYSLVTVGETEKGLQAVTP